MNKTKDLETAWAWARDARLEAIRQKRELHAAPRRPFEAQPGHEAQFEALSREIRTLEVILSELESAHAGAQRAEVKQKAIRLRDIAADLLLVFGLASLTALGLAAAFITWRFPDPVVQSSAVIGVALSLAWAVRAVRR